MLTNQELRSYILNLTDQWFGITYLQIAVAVLVAILGIVNTLTVSITDRRQELGVLQAVGGLRRQIRGTIWIEALTIAVIGVALGFTLGAAQLFYSLEIARRDLAGIRLSMSIRWALRSRSFRPCWSRLFSRPLDRPSRPCAARSWRLWSMNRIPCLPAVRGRCVTRRMLVRSCRKHRTAVVARLNTMKAC